MLGSSQEMGHKQAQRHHGATSALPPKADKQEKARLVRFVPKADKCTAAKIALFDHFVGGHEQLVRHCEAQRLRGLEVYG